MLPCARLCTLQSSGTLFFCRLMGCDAMLMSQELSLYKKRELPGRLEGLALEQHYSALLAKYLPAGSLRW